MKSLVFWAWLMLIVAITAHKHGAPSSSCGSMAPRHRSDAQTSASPFTLTATEDDGSYQVTLSSPNRDKFKGFFIQARSTDDDTIVEGTFTETHKLSKWVQCGSYRSSALTHVKSHHKREVTTTWTPAESSANKNFLFKATVVEHYRTFWENVTSETFTVPAVPLKDVNQILEDVQQIIPLPQTQEVQNYDSCGNSEGCFGYPYNCIPENEGCQIVVRMKPANNSIHFHLTATFSETDGWVAVGLSEDDEMGEDFVTECYLSSNKSVAIQHSWNFGHPQKYNVILELTPTNIVKTLKDGVITCSWLQKAQSIRGVKFDPINQNYFLLLAKGPLTSLKTKSFHTIRVPSSTPVNFTAHELITGSPSLLIKLHATLMMTAWILFIGVAMIIALFFKEDWSNTTICGKQLWFKLHQFMVIIGYLMVIGGISVIVYHKEGWSMKRSYYHSLLGIISVGLVNVQVLGGFLRPAPTSAWRPAFNFLHLINGSAAFILAVITVFYGLSFEELNFHSYIFPAFLVYFYGHIASLLFLQLHACCAKMKDKCSKQDDSFSCFKMLILFVNVLIAIAVSAIIVLSIWYKYLLDQFNLDLF